MSKTSLAGGYTVLDVVMTHESRWIAAGGTAANIAANLAYLGWSSGLVARIGADAAGKTVRTDLNRLGVDTSRLQLSDDVATPIIRHQVTAKGHRYAFGCRLCGRGKATHRPAPPELAQDLIARGLADVFVFDRPSRINLELARAHSSDGRLVVYEPSTPSSSRAHTQAVAAARVVKFSAQRGSKIGPRLPARRPDQLTIVTHGDQGSEYWLGTQSARHVAAADVAALDAGGAGDWMTAGLVYRLPETWTHQTMKPVIEWAQSLAALSTLVPGARTLSAIPRTNVLARIRRMHDGSVPTVKFEVPRVRNDDGRCAGCGLPE